MEWVVRWFMHMSAQWVGHRNNADNAIHGLCAFAERNIAAWDELGKVAEMNFRSVNPAYTPIWAPRGIPVDV